MVFYFSPFSLSNPCEFLSAVASAMASPAGPSRSFAIERSRLLLPANRTSELPRLPPAIWSRICCPPARSPCRSYSLVPSMVHGCIGSKKVTLFLALFFFRSLESSMHRICYVQLSGDQSGLFVLLTARWSELGRINNIHGAMKRTQPQDQSGSFVLLTAWFVSILKCFLFFSLNKNLPSLQKHDFVSRSHLNVHFESINWHTGQRMKLMFLVYTSKNLPKKEFCEVERSRTWKEFQ